MELGAGFLHFFHGGFQLFHGLANFLVLHLDLREVLFGVLFGQHLFRDIKTHTDVSRGFAVLAHNRRHGGNHPVWRAFFLFVFNLALPDIAAANRRPQVFEDFRGRIWVAHDAVWLSHQFFDGVARNFAELLVRVGHITLEVRLRNERGLFEYALAGFELGFGVAQFANGFLELGVGFRFFGDNVKKLAETRLRFGCGGCHVFLVLRL